MTSRGRASPAGGGRPRRASLRGALPAALPPSRSRKSSDVQGNPAGTGQAEGLRPGRWHRDRSGSDSGRACWMPCGRWRLGQEAWGARGARGRQRPHLWGLAGQEGGSRVHPALGPRPAARPRPACHGPLAYFPWSLSRVTSGEQVENVHGNDESPWGLRGPTVSRSLWRWGRGRRGSCPEQGRWCHCGRKPCRKSL